MTGIVLEDETRGRLLKQDGQLNTIAYNIREEHCSNGQKLHDGQPEGKDGKWENVPALEVHQYGGENSPYTSVSRGVEIMENEGLVRPFKGPRDEHVCFPNAGGG
jgi:hypothetical protein